MASHSKNHIVVFDLEINNKLEKYTGDITEKFKRYFDDMLSDPSFVDNILEIHPNFSSIPGTRSVTIELKHAIAPNIIINYLNRIPEYIQ